MKKLRKTRLRRFLAALALLGALLNVGLLPRHALMQLAAAQPLTAAEQWSRDNNIPICHSGGITTLADKGSSGVPGKLKVSFCVVCASALASAIEQEPPQIVRHAIFNAEVSYAAKSAFFSARHNCANFDARGPPVAI